MWWFAAYRTLAAMAKRILSKTSSSPATRAQARGILLGGSLVPSGKADASAGSRGLLVCRGVGPRH